MSMFFKSVVFVIAFNNFVVTGLDFTFSKEKVLLGSKGTLTMTCSVNQADVEYIYLIQIRRLKSTKMSGLNSDDWQTLAETSGTPTLTNDIQAVASTKDYFAGGSWDSTTPANTYLTLSMNIEKLVCADARYYRCDLSYKTSAAGGGVLLPNKNATFSAYVKPQVTSLIARKNGLIVQGMSPSAIASAKVGDELELTCTANIGSLPGTIIRWHRTSETSPTNDFIGYIPPEGTYDRGTAISDNQCGYTRAASIRYNVTAADANRDNNLAFECYVTVSGDPYGNSYTSENNPRFNTDVSKPGDGMTTNTMITTDEKEECLTAEVIAAIVIAFFTVGVLIGIALTWLKLSRKQKMKGRTEQSQHQTTSISRETELNVSSHLPNTYEQLQNRADTENNLAYDSLQVNTSAAQNSHSQYESLNQGAGTSHTYTGLEYNQ